MKQVLSDIHFYWYGEKQALSPQWRQASLQRPQVLQVLSDSKPDSSRGIMSMLAVHSRSSKALIFPNF